MLPRAVGGRLWVRWEMVRMETKKVEEVQMKENEVGEQD